MYPYNTYSESIHDISKIPTFVIFFLLYFALFSVNLDTCINAYTCTCDVYISRNMLIHNYTKRCREIRARVCGSFIYI